MDELTIVVIWLALWVLTGCMAAKRGRSAFGWMMLSLLLSSLLTVIILAFIGETQKRKYQRIEAEERYRSQIARKYSDDTPRRYAEPPQPTTDHERYKPQSTANPLGKTINDLYKK